VQFPFSFWSPQGPPPGDPNPITLSYASDFDTNGVIYFAGKNFATGGTWTNPHTAGRCTVVLSSNVLAGSPAILVDHAINDTYASNNSSGEWLAIDLGSGRSLTVGQYWMKQRQTTATQAMRNWKLQGTNTVATNDITGVNAATWTDLDTRVNDTTMSNVITASTGLYTVGGSPSAYRYFRIITTGPNANVTDYNIQLCEIEFYGVLGY
jgi:hypothetical protein